MGKKTVSSGGGGSHGAPVKIDAKLAAELRELPDMNRGGSSKFTAEQDAIIMQFSHKDGKALAAWFAKKWPELAPLTSESIKSRRRRIINKKKSA